MKCIDQIQRPLLYEVLRSSGMPEQIIRAYQDMLDNLSVVNNISGHVGLAHAHPCGIPQGCPLSMSVIGLLFRPWIVRMQQIGRGHEAQVQPRVLADDILITATGPEQVPAFCEAYDATIEYVSDMGGRMAPDKSLLVSTSRIIRKKMRDYTWTRLRGAKLKFHTTFRDLGTQLNAGMRQIGNTLNARASQAISAAERLACVPMSSTKK